MTENRRVSHPFQTVAIDGDGAVSSFFGPMLARARHAVVLVKQVEAGHERA